MRDEATIKNFIQDKGNREGDDGRLVINVKSIPNEDIETFLIWLGKQFIEKGGLYAVDIENPKGIYRVYKNEKEKNQWIDRSK